MKVILIADVKGSGKKDDIVEVSDGYARNYLIKNKLAKEATPSEINAVTNKKKSEEFHRAEEVKKIKEEAAKIKGREVVCKVKCGENGKIFGSVTNKEIAETLAADGFVVDKKKIVLKDPIKTPGIYTVEIKYLPDISSTIKVKVES